ncbi:dihydrofolate reductase family protein [Streptomyces avicenniae]|uniref:dihydrofolate reductase family protein n=1 Tax=Streptomyces avicenniae TaxID=500153 RepID=UPI00069A2545|nr:dihydrofolate reductase family protein [Streptomyces avicenniae]
MRAARRPSFLRAIRVAGPAGEADFFPPGDEGQAAAYAAWINARFPETVPTALRAAHGLADAASRRFDTVLMGAGTYRTVLDASPASPHAHLRQYVLSRTLPPEPEADVTVAGGDALALVRDLKRRDGQNVWLCGGGRLAGALLTEIDELILKSYPVVAGSGVPLFDATFTPTPFAVTWYARR